MKKFIFGILLIILVIILMLGFSSAELLQFDNVKSYDAINKEVTIINTFGLGKDIAKIKLDTPLKVIVPVGYQNIANLTINTYEEEYLNPLEKMEFQEINNNYREINKNFDYKYWGDIEINVYDYKEVCEESKNETEGIFCYNTIYGEHKEIIKGWKEFNKDKLLKGTYKIGIFTNVNLGDAIEWIPTYYGVKINEFASYIQSSGTKTYYSVGDIIYTIETYTSNGTFNLTGNMLNVSILIVGGGGGGAGGGSTGRGGAGGGGAGGLIYLNDLNMEVGNYNIIVGAGGSGGGSDSPGLNGQNSSINSTFTAWGGGGGGAYDGGNGLFGGSGGGGAGSTTSTGNGGGSVYGQGKAGGKPLTNSQPPGGGGGGANANGSTTSGANAGAGGNGLGYNIYNQTILYYAGGGGGNAWETNNDGAGGIGGGGAGKYNAVGVSGTANTGGGGGAGVYASGGGAGGSGIIIIRYTLLNVVPSVILNSPIDYYNITNPTIDFNITAIDSEKIENVTLYIDGVLNETNNSGFNGTYIFTKTLSEGGHNWSILAWNNNSIDNQSETRNLIIDYSNPIVTFTYPLNQTYTISYVNTSDLNVTFNWSSYDISLNSCWYSKNGGTNTTLICNTNITTNTTYGSSVNILACANDSLNNIGCSSRTATYKYKVFEINQTYNNPILENTPQDYYANIYMDTSLYLNSIYFTYDGVNYSASYLQIENYTRLEKTSFYAPSVSSDENKSLTWWALLNDSSRINLSTQIQQVNNLVYSSVCNATYPYYIFNFTLKDEKTQLNINGTIETDIKIKTTNGTTTLYNWNTIFYNTSSYLCSNFPVSYGNSYIVEGTIKYYAINENYSAMVEYYNFLNFDYNNNTYYKNISLYDLNVTEGTEFQLTFKDSSYRAREDILIYIYRQYLPEGIFKVVELPKTDSNGQTIVHLVRNDVVYNFVAVDSSGNVLGILNNVLAFCEDYTIGDCKINFQGTTSETDLEDYLDGLGLSYTLDFDSTTNIISFIFSSTTNEDKDVRLEVISSAIVTNRTICNTSLSAISGTLTCDVSSIVNSSSSVNVKIYLSEEEIINENLFLDTSNWNVPGVIFFGFLFILIIGIMFIESKEGMIIGVILGLVVLVSLGVVKGKIIGFTSGILWLIIVGVIILIKLNKENKQ